jgi:L-alanine-DL-glutamate epimerase-like enolase superfamily enzyme
VQITAAETMIVEIPFPFPQAGTGIGLNAWRSLEFTLVRLEDERGNVGWGEGFGYSTVESTKAMIDRLIIPRLLAAPIKDVAGWNLETQRALHLHGRYGVTMFAISGVDIALWDLLARRERVPVHTLLRADGEPRHAFRNYASLMRYDEQPLVTEACEAVLAAGYTAVKMHERLLDSIAAGRNAVGPDVPLATDVNCGYEAEWVESERARFEALRLAWLEEPIFPPEDFATLHGLRSPQLRIGAGENWCTSVQFAAAARAQAVDLMQPSVTKVGGISEFLRVCDVAAEAGVPIVPHCPYCGRTSTTSRCCGSRPRRGSSIPSRCARVTGCACPRASAWAGIRTWRCSRVTGGRERRGRWCRVRDLQPCCG